MKKIILLAAIFCMPAMLLNAAPVRKKPSTQAVETAMTYVDLGLPSGTLWAASNEDEFYTYPDAVAKFGDVLPSKAQWEELKETCRWEWDKKLGCVVTGPNGNKINLPCVGYYTCDGEFRGKGEYGEYWTRNNNPSNTMNAWIFDIEANLYVCDLSYQCYRLSIRLVKNHPAKNVQPVQQVQPVSTQE